MKPYYLIINPSRYPVYSRKLAKISGRLSRAHIFESRSSEHFEELIYRFCRSPVEDLIVWGGDGTANAAINGLMRHKQQWAGRKHIGFLRGGSGNGIQDSYEVPITLRGQLKSYLDSIEHGYTQSVDLLKLTGERRERYGQLLGIGLDARVLDLRNRPASAAGGEHVPPGLLRYLKAGFQVLGRGLKPHRLELYNTLREGKYALRGVRTNAEIPFEEARFRSAAPQVEVGTRPYYGNFFKICPDVVCNDGYLGVYFYNFTSVFSVVLNLFNLWKGRHHMINQRWAKKGHPLIERFEVREARFSSGEKFPVHIDGDLIEPRREADGYALDVAIAPQALSFLVPQSFYVKFHPFTMDRDSTRVFVR